MRPRLAPALTHAELIRLCQTGRTDVLHRPATQPTGQIELDQALPGGGLPIGAVTEIMTPAGIGELRLVMPVLARLTREARYIAFVQPPHLPYPPALARYGVQLERVIAIRAAPAQALWASEQALRCSAFGAVLLWPVALTDKETRRLQLAAEASNNLAIVYRPLSAAHMTSPAALRLRLHAGTPLRIEIKKCRGGRGDRIVHCALDVAV